MNQVDENNRLSELIHASRVLFANKGYAHVGMREIASQAKCSPMQIYRLGLNKEDLLAEVSISLTDEQLKKITVVLSIREDEAIDDFIIRYLTLLYESDIENIAIRRETAAYGWKWSAKYEERIITQVFGLLKPISDALINLGYDQIEARCMGIWSLYYVGFRGAVVHELDAYFCIQSITPSLRLLLQYKN